MPLDTRRVVCAGAHVALCTSLFLEQHKRPRKVIPRTLGSEGSCHTLSPHQAAVGAPWQVPQFLAITEWRPWPRLARPVLRIPGEVTPVRREHVPCHLCPGDPWVWAQPVEECSSFFYLEPRKRRRPDLPAQGSPMSPHTYLPSLLVHFTHSKTENALPCS